MKKLNTALVVITLILFLRHGYASWDAARDANYVKAIYFQLSLVVVVLFQIYLGVVKK